MFIFGSCVCQENLPWTMDMIYIYRERESERERERKREEEEIDGKTLDR